MDLNTTARKEIQTLQAPPLVSAADWYSHRYINFAYGDESLETVYGDSLPRLQALKK